MWRYIVVVNGLVSQGDCQFFGDAVKMATKSVDERIDESEPETVINTITIQYQRLR